MLSERRLYKRTVALWLALVLAHLAWYLAPFALRAVPPVPQGEVHFANDVGFQAVVFVFAFLPYWCAVLIAALSAEFVVFRYRKRGNLNGGASAP